MWITGCSSLAYHKVLVFVVQKKIIPCFWTVQLKWKWFNNEGVTKVPVSHWNTTNMADPTVQSFCCRRPQGQHLLLTADTLMREFSSKPYLITTLCSSVIGMVGALYQIIRFFLNREGDFRLYYLQSMRGFRVPKRLLAQTVGKKILLWLAAADLLASSGVFIRSSFWIYVRPNATSAMFPEDIRIIFCAVVSGLIQYFYTCTWLWTLCYAINIRTYLKDDVIEEKKYHAFVWTTAAVLTGIGTTVLYYPNAEWVKVGYCNDSRDV